MPLYEYACSRCPEKREVLARSAEAAQAPACPVCGEAMQREWAPVAARTKSGGSCVPSRGGFS